MATMSRSLRIVVFTTLLAGLPHSEAYGQLGAMVFQQTPPQAQTREELYAFLDLVDNSKSERFFILASEFVERFPRSEFGGFVHRMRMNAYREMNDHHNTVRAGEKALELNQQDIDVLLTLANILPHGIKATDPLSVTLNTAEGYARRALKEIMALKAPRTLSLDDWEEAINVMKASAHCALGLVALKRGRYSDSVAEFEICTEQNTRATGPQYYMFGVALISEGKSEQARSALQRAAELGPKLVTEQAEAKLRSLEKN
jgi:tetratricopeptide (TPR) repeat protein